MAKPELGTKRLCTNCSAKFYDINKDPIVCPKCHTVMEAAMVGPRAQERGCRSFCGHGFGLPRAGGPETLRSGLVAVAEGVDVGGAAAAAEEEVAAPETAEAEFVSLEEADAEAQGKKPEGEAVEGGEEDVELEDEGMDDATFIEEQEEGDEDVTDIIGDVDDEEET